MDHEVKAFLLRYSKTKVAGIAMDGTQVVGIAIDGTQEAGIAMDGTQVVGIQVARLAQCVASEWL